MDVAAASEDTGTLQALKALDSLESKINQVQVAYQQFYTTIGAESAWKFFLEGIRNVIDTLNNLPKLFGKIPIGAIAIITDIVNLVKTVALNGLAEIAHIWTNKIHELENTKTNTQPIGEEAVNGVVKGITSRAHEIKEAMQAAVDQVTNGKQKVETGEKLVNFSNQSFEARSFSLSKADEQLSMNGKIVDTTQFENLLLILQQLGNEVPDVASKIPLLKQAFESGKYGEVATILNSIRGQARTIGEEFILTGQKVQQGASSFKEFIKNSNHLSSDLTGLGSALRMIATLINTTSDSGRIASGSLMLLAGALTTVGIAIKAIQEGAKFSMPWMLAATAVISVINGLSTIIETPTEKLEKLTKQAEELNNEAKKVKAEYNTLQRSVDKLDELEQKRYDNAEAAEEYQSAVDELADSFPELIRGFDEAGNIVIDLSNAEEVLANARQKSLQATYEAAKAEQEASAQALENSKQSIKNANNNITGLIQEQTKNNNQIIRKVLNNSNEYGIYDQLTNKGLKLENLLMPKYLKGMASEMSLYNGYIIDPNNIKDLESFEEALSDYSDIPDIQELIELLESIQNSPQTVVDNVKEIVNSFILELDDIDFTTEEGQNRFSEFKQAYDKLNDFDKQYFNDQMTNYEELVKNIELIIDNAKTDTANKKQTISSYIKLTQSQKEGWDFLENNTQAALTLTSSLVDIWDTGTLESFISSEDFKNRLEEFYNFYNELSDDQKELYEQLGVDTSAFSAQDIISALDLEESGFKDYVEQIYTNGEIQIERINKAFKEMRKDEKDISLGSLQGKIGKLDKEVDFSTNVTDFIISQGKAINELSDAGYTWSAKQLSNYTSELIESLYNEDVEVTDRSAIIKILKDANLKTKEGIDAAIEQIQGSGVDQSIISETVSNLEEQRDLIIENMFLSIKANLDSMLEKAEDDTKIISKATSGMNVKEANEFIDAAKEWDIELSFDTSFIENGDKLVLTEQAFNEVQNKYSAYLGKVATDAQNNLNQAKKLKVLNENGEVRSFVGKNFNELDQVAQFLKANGFDETTKEYLNEAGNITEKGQEAIQTIFDNTFKALDEATYLMTSFGQMFFKEQNWNKGNYDSLKTSLEKYGASLQELAAGEILNLSAEDYDLRAAKDKINAAYSNLISDALDKGLDKINLADYQGLVGGTANLRGTLVQLVHRYAKMAGKSLEETNDLIIQAIEKESKDSTGAAADALKNITFITNDLAYASLETINQLANALGKGVEQLIVPNSYDAALNAYQVNMANLTDEELAKIANASNVVADSIANFLNSIADSIGKGIQGKLSYADKDNLISNLKQYNIELNDIDFSRTAEGLKLSEDSAIRLYQQISAIDALQGRLVFNELRKALETTGSNFENISTTTAYVTELQNKIVQATQAIQKNQQMGSPQEWVDSENKKLDKLQKELQLAQEIQRAQSQSPEQYDFMGRDLPDYLKGPQNYWNSVGEAFKAMNEAGKTGKMEIDDFYNIVNEMSNLAAISGNSLQFMGMEIDGSAEKAAALIEKGMGYLTNIKGDGVKLNMKQFAADMQAGAADMGEGFDDAVKEMAKSQIKMLDGMIKLLETIVAMEKLGDIDTDESGTLDLSEIFKVKYDERGIQMYEKYWDEFTDDFQNLSTKILKDAETNTDLANALRDFKINGISLHEMFQDATDGIKDLNIDAEAYSAAMNALYQAAISGDYNLDNIMTSIQEVLAGTGQTFEIDAGDGTKVAIGYGATITSDENGKYEFNGKKYDTPEKALQASRLEALTNTEASLDEEEQVYTITTDTNVELKTKLNESGELVYEVAGKDYTTKQEAIHAMYLEYTKTVNYNDRLTEEAWRVQQDIKLETNLVTDVSTVDRGQIRDFLNTSEKDIQEIIDASDNGVVTIDGLTFELGNDSTAADLKQQVIDQLGINDLVTGIATGITQAFEGSAGDKIGEAIKTGIQSAFSTGVEGTETGEVPIPNLILNPESVEINMGDVTPTVSTGTETTEIPISSITVNPTTVNLNTEGSTYNDSGVSAPPMITKDALLIYYQLLKLAGINTDDSEIQENIPSEIEAQENLKIIYNLLKLVNPGEEFDESEIYIPQYLTEHPEITAILALMTLKSLEGTTEYNEDNVSGPKTGQLEKKFEIAALLAKIVLNSSKDTEFLEGTIEIGESNQPSITITQLLEAIATGSIKINSPEGGSSVEEGTITIGKGQNQITLPETEFYTIINNIIAKSSSSNIDYSQIPIPEEVFLGTITGKVKVNLNFEAQNVAKELTKITNNYDWNGLFNDKGALAKQIGGKDAAIEYVETLNKIVKAGGQLSNNQIQNLETIKKIFSSGGGPVGRVDKEFSGIDDIIALSEVNNDNLTNVTSTVQQFAELTVGELPEVATAMEDVVTQAQILEEIEWDKIAEGINNVTTAQINNSIQSTEQTSGGNNSESGGQSSDLLQTGSLSVAIAEVNTAVGTITETFSTAAEQINNVASAIEDIKTDKVDAIGEAQEQIKANNVQDIARASLQIESGPAISAKNAINAISPTGAQQAKQAINSIGGTMTLGVNVNVNVATTGAGAAKGTIASVGVSKGSATRSGNKASWRQSYAYAAGKRTLMGELGSELVVTDGHYFLVGQNGPEFVDLAADAIVFNHIQTKKLLKNGSIPTRGTPITNERNATSLATGNTSGPAMASASAALAALKQIRAMWQSMLDASSKDLGTGAGSGGGGGGGGGGDDKNKSQLGNVTGDLQRWYNLLRQIEQLEKQITKEESLQNLYENDRIANGDKIYQSYQKQLKLLDSQIAKEKEVNELQQSKYDRLQQEFNSSIYGLVYTANEEGLIQFKGEGLPGEGVGLDVLENLNRRDVNGQPIGASITAKSQFEYLEQVLRAQGYTGNLLDELKWNDDGTRVAEQNAAGQFVKIEKDENDQDVETVLEGEELDQIYVAMMENFYNNMDSRRDELDTLYDGIQDRANDIIEKEAEQNEIIQKIIDNQLDLEGKVMTALKDMRQAEIDEAQKTRDAYQKSADKYVEGLTDALNKERQMYQNEQSQNELEKLQAQLAILQRSGGSNSQIQNLQNQIAAKQQDMYFNERQQEIDAIKEASDRQLEKLDQQIQLMTELLAYEDEHGLLWDDVYQVMGQSENDIVSFIETFTKSYMGMSATEKNQQLTEDLQSAQLYKAAVEDGFAPSAAQEESNKEEIKTSIDEARSDIVSATSEEAAKREAERKANEKSSGGGGGSGGGSGSGGQSEFKIPSPQEVIEPLITDAQKDKVLTSLEKEYQEYVNEQMRLGQESGANITPLSYEEWSAKRNKKRKTASKATSIITGKEITGEKIVNALNKIASNTKTTADSEKKKTTTKKISGVAITAKKYATGGLNTEAGLAWLDGTPSKPEYVLNAEQTDILRKALLGSNPASVSLNNAAYSGISGMANSNIYNSIERGENIEINGVTMNLNVPAIANDYDAKRAGEMAFNEMVKIARKTGTVGLSRR